MFSLQCQHHYQTLILLRKRSFFFYFFVRPHEQTGGKTRYTGWSYYRDDYGRLWIHSGATVLVHYCPPGKRLAKEMEGLWDNPRAKKLIYSLTHNVVTFPLPAGFTPECNKNALSLLYTNLIWLRLVARHIRLQ